ncbi:MAG: hypothetical protein IKQ43_09630 [Treponema sp.]|nr:hypothetical protein [Treponema sp.]MBR7079205.1 hypothetical protein [Treponema sp.]
MSDTHDSDETGIADYNKTRMMKFGIFTLIVVVLFAILLLFTLLSRNSWNEGMKDQINSALEANELQYKTGEQDRLHSSISMSCVSYTDAENPSVHIVLLRTPTLYGPFPALYVYDESSGNVDFIDLLLIDGKSKEAVVASAKNMQVQYWKNRIPLIINTSDKNQEEEK